MVLGVLVGGAIGVGLFAISMIKLSIATLVVVKTIDKVKNKERDLE